MTTPDGVRGLLKTWELAKHMRTGKPLLGLEIAGDALAAALEARVGVFDLIAHLRRQRAFSERTFGHGTRSKGIIDHIGKELREIEAAPHDLTEWVDVVILALDGAWRAGYTPEQIAAAIAAKQEKNEGRTYPDWRTMDPDKAIEHDRTGEPTPPPAATGDEALLAALDSISNAPKNCHKQYMAQWCERAAAALRQRGEELKEMRDDRDSKRERINELETELEETMNGEQATLARSERGGDDIDESSDAVTGCGDK